MSDLLFEIVHYNLEEAIKIYENEVSLLIVENPNEFYKYACELVEQANGVEGGFIIKQNGESLSFEKECDVVSNLFTLDFNDKKLINLLYKKLERIGNDGETVVKLGELNVKLHELLGDLFYKTQFCLDFNEFQLQDVLKASSVKFERTYDSLLEKLIYYVNTIIELKNNRLFVFVNLKSVLSDKQLEKFYYHCNCVKASILLLESSKLRSLLSCEHATIITEDLCEIIENFNSL